MASSDPGEYNMLVTNHGTIMIFWVAMPVLIAGFGNYIIPLMIGCDDMVFPRLNRLSFQIFLVSALVLILSFFVRGGGFGGAWTSYPPLSSVAEFSLTDWGASLWILAVALEFVSFLLGGINFITTTMNARAPGMKNDGHSNCSLVYSSCSYFIYGVCWTTICWSCYVVHGSKNWYDILPCVRWW